MKIITRGVIDIATMKVEEEDFYEYEGPLAQCVAAAIVGGALITGVAGGVASSNAASTQAAAATTAAGAALEGTQETNALNYTIYEQNLENSSPFLQTAGAAEAALANGFGLGQINSGSQQIYGSGSSANPNAAQGVSSAPAATSPTIAGGSVGNARVGGFQTAPNMSGTQGSPTVQPLGGGAYTTGNNNLVLSGNQGPSPGSPSGPGAASSTIAPTNGGTSVTGTAPSTNIPGIGNVSPVNSGATQSQLTNAGQSVGAGSLLAGFNNTDLQSQLNPSYNFILGQGQKALTNYDSAHGITGGAATEEQGAYAENTASTYYQQAFNNYLTQQQTNVANLESLAGNGSVNVANASGTSAANSITQNTQAGIGQSNQYLTSAAAASAAGTVGVANSLSGATGNAVNGLVGYNLTQQLINNQNNGAQDDDE